MFLNNTDEINSAPTIANPNIQKMTTPTNSTPITFEKPISVIRQITDSKGFEVIGMFAAIAGILAASTFPFYFHLDSKIDTVVNKIDNGNQEIRELIMDSINNTNTRIDNTNSRIDNFYQNR